VLFVVGAGALVGVNAISRWYVDQQLRRVQVTGLRATAGGTDNILLVGSTDRCGLKQQSVAFGLCSQGVTGINSDVVMILHLDRARHRAAILSIPRDTFVPNARSTGAYKIDAALFQGSSQLVSAIEEDFGIPINHYVELNFDGFQGVVDAIGGIRMYFPEPVYDDLSGLNVSTPGCHILNGSDALAVARARHLQYKPPNVTATNPARWPYDPESDLSRIRRNHEFLRVLASTVANRGLGNPITDQKLLQALVPQLKVDTSFTLSDMVDLLLAFNTLDPTAVPQYTLPVSVVASTSFLYKGSDYGNVALPVEPDDHQTIDQFLHGAPTTDTMTGKPLPAPGTITVAVQNATGRRDEATKTATALRGLAFQADPITDGAPTGPISETIVSYPTPAARPQAERVARALSGVVILAQDPTPSSGSAAAMVTVRTGTDFTVTAPAVVSATTAPVASTSPHSTSPHSTSPTTTTTTTNPGITTHQLTPATPATSQLAEFDPRSCTPTGGPGT
jgi:LCP family protein required for cell wall assembly